MNCRHMAAALGIAAVLTAAVPIAEVAASEINVRIVNLTRGQVFSRIVVWTHNARFGPFFGFGGVASEELRIIAEDGNPEPMAAFLSGDPNVREIVVSDGPLLPGEAIDLTLQRGSHVSLAAMLVNTNDTFFALRGERVRNQRQEFFQPGWDAGTEANNENCGFIPGPACPPDSGNQRAPEDAEGFIFTQQGIHGVNGGVPTSDLDPAQHDWRNPVAYIVVSRTDR